MTETHPEREDLHGDELDDDRAEGRGRRQGRAPRHHGPAARVNRRSAIHGREARRHVAQYQRLRHQERRGRVNGALSESANHSLIHSKQGKKRKYLASGDERAQGRGVNDERRLSQSQVDAFEQTRGRVPVRVFLRDR